MTIRVNELEQALIEAVAQNPTLTVKYADGTPVSADLREYTPGAMTLPRGTQFVTASTLLASVQIAVAAGCGDESVWPAEVGETTEWEISGTTLTRNALVLNLK